MESTDESQKCPKILYKYCGFEGGRDTLTYTSLRYRHPNEFNDPFEFLPEGYTDVTPENIKNQWIEIVRSKPHLLSLINEKLGLSYSLEQLIEHLKNDDNPRLKNIIDLIICKLNNKDWEAFRDEASKDVVLCSFSEKNDDILMWSHYTDEHKGIVIGFYASYFNPLYQVHYQDQRVLIPLVSKLESMVRKKTVEMIISTKNTKWGYEKEWRQIIPSSEVKIIKEEDKLKNKEAIYTKDFNPDSVACVILGWKMNESQEDQIKALLPKYPNCKTIQHAKLHEKDFALEII